MLWQSIVSVDRLHTVYVGGGTPSLWSADNLVSLIRLFEHLGALEVTVEANPGDCDWQWFHALFDVGVNRFSIGIQSLDEQRLRFLGRRHDVNTAKRAVEMALSLDGVRVSGDLIYGTPGQTLEGLKNEITLLTGLGLQHVSAYELTVAEGTPLARQVAQGKIKLPEESEMTALWEVLGRAAADLGFERYEVSSYCLPGHKSLHNCHYWNGGPYLGLGAGAHGFFEYNGQLYRYANSPDIDDYMSQLEQQSVWANSAFIRRVTSDDPISEAMFARELVMLGLRTQSGVDLSRVFALVSKETQQKWQGEMNRIATDGFCRIHNQRLIPCESGLLLADSLAERFF